MEGEEVKNVSELSDEEAERRKTRKEKRRSPVEGSCDRSRKRGTKWIEYWAMERLEGLEGKQGRKSRGGE